MMIPALKALVAHPDAKARAAICSYLDVELNLATLEASNAETAIETIKRDGAISCVICEANSPRSCAADVYHFLKSQQRRPPMIVLSDTPRHDVNELEGLSLGGYLERPFALSQLGQLVQKSMATAITTTDEVPNQTYLPIKTTTLLRLSPLACDVYVRLSADKFVKLMAEGDHVSIEDIKRYTAKNVMYLYIRRDGKDVVLKKLDKELQNLTEAPHNLPVTSVYELVASAHEAVHEIYHSFGLDESAKRVIKSSVDVAVATVRRNPEFVKLLMHLDIDKNGYLSSHSIMLAHVSCAIASMMRWGSEATQQKLAMAALVHDLPLQRDEFALLELQSDYIIEVPPERVIEYEEHPTKAAELVKAFSDFPPDVDMIVTQHHELPDGSGFPRGLKWPNVGALSALFIVAEKLVSFYARKQTQGEPRSMQTFFVTHAPTFSRGEFLKIFTTMRNSAELTGV